MKVKVAVAGAKLAAMAKEANGYGLLRIRADLKHGRDPRGVGLEHAAHADERAAAIDHVLATGTPAQEILQKWRRAEVARETTSRGAR